MADAILRSVAGDPREGGKEGSGSGESVRVALAMAAIGLAFVAILVLTVEPLRTGIGNAVQGDTASLRDEIRDLHFGGVLIVLALAVLHAVVWYPAEILDAAAGFVYGFWAALPLVMAGWLLNGVVAYKAGRHVARPLLYRVVDGLADTVTLQNSPSAAAIEEAIASVR